MTMAVSDLTFDDLIPAPKKTGIAALSFDDLIQKPEDPGAAQAAWLGFGRMADKGLQGAKQMALTVAEAVGNKEATAELARMKETEQLRDEGYAELEKQHPYATMAGEATPLIAMPMGGTLKAAAMIGALPGLASYGSTKERLTRGGAGALGGAGGYGVGKAIGAVVSPGMKAASPEAQRLAEVAEREGIPLDVAQLTNNPVLQNTKAALTKLPWTATGQAIRAEKQSDAYGAAVLRKFGADGRAATPDVMGDSYARIGGNIEKAASDTALVLDDPAIAKLAQVERQFLRRLPTDQKPVIRSYLDDLTNLIGKEIPGDVYQRTRSELGKLAFETENSTVKAAAKGMQKLLDDAFDRQASPDAVRRMHKAREEYAAYSTTADAVKRSRAQDGRLSPKQMYATAQGDIPGFERGAGGQFADLMRAGRQFLPDNIPNSGTPQQQAYMNLLTAGSLGGLGALGGHLSNGDPSSGAMLGLAGFGLSKSAQGLLNSPALTKYLTSKLLEEEEKRLLAQMGGRIGLLGAAATTD